MDFIAVCASVLSCGLCGQGQGWGRGQGWRRGQGKDWGLDRVGGRDGDREGARDGAM